MLRVPLNKAIPTTPRRTLDFSVIALPTVIGKGLVLPDLRLYLQRVHSDGGWGPEEKIVQAADGFKFDGKTLTYYEKKVLTQVLGGKKLERIYFPAVYAGVVARALTIEGYDVFASDLSPYWVGKAQLNGLHAEVRSFEQIPTRKEFDADAFVVFEPNILDHTLISYLALLRMLSRPLPYIYVTSDMSNRYYYKSIPDAVPVALKTFYTIETGNGLKYLKFFPEGRWGSIRIGFDYGARHLDHVVFKDPELGKVFRFSCLVSSNETIQRAALDLKLLEEGKRWIRGGAISVTDLAKELGKEIGEICAALARLRDVLNNRLDDNAKKYSDHIIIRS